MPARKEFTGVERRLHRRYERVLPVRFHVTGDTPGEWYDATTRDISHGGVCVMLLNPPRDLAHRLKRGRGGQRMELQLPLPPLEFGPAPALRVECEVRWARREGWRHPRLVMGVAFANLADTARRRIHHYIVTEFQQEYPDHEDPAQP